MEGGVIGRCGQTVARPANMVCRSEPGTATDHGPFLKAFLVLVTIRRIEPATLSLVQHSVTT